MAKKMEAQKKRAEKKPERNPHWQDLGPNDAELRQKYLKERWAQLLDSFGFDPVHTESAARIVAEKAAKIIDEQHSTIRLLSGRIG